MADFVVTVIKALNRIDPDGEFSMNEIEDEFGSEGINFIRDRETDINYQAGDYGEIIVGGHRRPGDEIMITLPVYDGISLDGQNIQPLMGDYYQIGQRSYDIRIPATQLYKQESNPKNLALMIMHGVNCIQSVMMLESSSSMNEVVRRLGFINFTGSRDTVVQLCWWFIVCRDSDGDWLAPLISAEYSYGLNLTGISTLRELIDNAGYNGYGLDRASCLWMLITGTDSPAPAYSETDSYTGYKPRAELAIAQYLYNLYDYENITTSPIRLVERGTASFEHEQMVSDLVLGTRSVYELAYQVDMDIPEDEYEPEEYFLENLKHY